MRIRFGCYNSESVSQVWPTQTNHYDCGVWSLCAIITVLYGYHTFANLLEDDMLSIWQLILSLIYTLPAM